MGSSRLREVCRSSDLTDIDAAAHGRQHQVALAHPAQEPVEFLQPLPAIGIRLVLVRGLHGLAKLVIVRPWIELSKL